MIRFATIDDIPKIMQFINDYWKKGHLLSVDRDFFEYEHRFGEAVSYVVSVDEQTDEINAILGYIPYGKTHRDVMTVMWKANHTASPALGLELFNYLKENGDVRIMASPGSNPKLKGLYKYLGYSFGKMTQWYRLNEGIKQYKVAKIEAPNCPNTTKNVCEYVCLEDWSAVEKNFDFKNYFECKPKPLKEEWYIKKRYFEHPKYSYLTYGIKDACGKVSTLLIFRKQLAQNSTVVRLVDVIGDISAIERATNLLDDLLNKYEAEYVDCYETGVLDELFKRGGWTKTEETSNIIPNYFSPFEMKNVDIYYFSSDKEVILFKGDGDQDRPN